MCWRMPPRGSDLEWDHPSGKMRITGRKLSAPRVSHQIGNFSYEASGQRRL